MSRLYWTVTTRTSTKARTLHVASAFAILALAAGCSQPVTPTEPSGSASTSVFGPPPPSGAGTTTVSFSGFDASTLTVNINTATTSGVGQPYIDQGKIQLEILVDASGNPVPCGTVGATYVRFDTFTNGGKQPVGGATSTSVDLDNLETTTNGAVHNAHCGDTICIRAHYVTGGGATHVDTHSSAGTSYEIVCAAGGCTLGQGYWEHHYPDNWPASVISGGLTLGTVSYTAAQLESILAQNPVAGNGLIALAHQLIAAKLNVANGADGSTIASAIASADALIGGLIVPPVGSGSLPSSATGTLTSTLGDYNDGITGPGACPSDDPE